MNLVEVEVASKLSIIWRHGGLVPEHGQQIGGAGWHFRQWYIEGTEAQRFRLADFPCRSWMCRKMRTVGSDVGSLWICDLNSLRLEWMELKYVEIQSLQSLILDGYASCMARLNEWCAVRVISMHMHTHIQTHTHTLPVFYSLCDCVLTNRTWLFSRTFCSSTCGVNSTTSRKDRTSQRQLVIFQHCF
jgi:hypothetical protein